MPLIDQIREQKLIELAKTRFAADLTEAELNVLRESASSLDSDLPKKDAPRPEIRPELVRWLASDPEAAPFLDPKGIRVYGVTLPRYLNLAECRIAVPLIFYRCTIKRGINLRSAETRGIYLLGCSVEGTVQADWIDAQGAIVFRESQFTSEVILSGARIRGELSFSGAKLEVEAKEGEEEVVGLSAGRAEIGGGVFLGNGFTSNGEIRLHGAQIKGDLDCSGAKLVVTEGKALSADGAEIGGAVFLSEKFTSYGEIRLPSVRIKGILDCSGAKMEVKEGNALSADGAEIGGSVFLRDGFTCSGTIRLLGAMIGGQLNFRGAKVAEVCCENLLLSGDLLWMGIQEPEKAALNLMGANVKNLREDRESWPQAGNLVLDGLSYEEVTLHRKRTEVDIENGRWTEELVLKVEDRIEWLMRQRKDILTEAHPWMFLAKHLEGKGDRRGAKHVVYTYRCLQAKSKWLPQRLLDCAFAWLEERPLRICWSIAITLFLGTLIFAGADRSGAMIQTVRIQPNAVKDDGEVKPVSPLYPKYQPFVYTLENAVPLLRLGMDDKWTPNPSPEFCVAWYPRWPWLYFISTYGVLVFFRWALIMWGWVQATILAAALADRFRK
jgi:hypothetical protein